MKSVSRRRFIAEVSGGVTALSASVAMARGRSWAPRFSASSIAFSGLPIEQACERIARLGFEGIDIWSAHAGCPHLDDVQRRLGPDGLKARTRQAQARPLRLLGLCRRLRTLCRFAGQSRWRRGRQEQCGTVPTRGTRPAHENFPRRPQTTSRTGREAAHPAGHRKPRCLLAGLGRFDQGVRRSERESTTGNRAGALPYSGPRRVGHRGNPRRRFAAFLLLRLAV